MQMSQCLSANFVQLGEKIASKNPRSQIDVGDWDTVPFVEKLLLCQ